MVFFTPLPFLFIFVSHFDRAYDIQMKQAIYYLKATPVYTVFKYESLEGQIGVQGQKNWTGEPIELTIPCSSTKPS